MEYLTVKQLSKIWKISERRIIKLCKEGRIDGAIKNGMVWLIPEETMKPSDKRNKISKYINTKKRVMIINPEKNIINYLIPLLKKSGFIIEIITDKDEIYENIKIYKIDYSNKHKIDETLKQTNKYYESLIFMDLEKENNYIKKYKESIVTYFANKMNSNSSIVLLENNLVSRLEEKLCKDFKINIGLRINTLSINIPITNNVFLNYKQIAEDLMSLLQNFKGTTGTCIKTDADYLEFNSEGRTKNLQTGEFYRAINNYFETLKKESTMWCASTMMEDEWTDEPLEMNFRSINLEAANRGANLERIFIFSRNKIKEFKNNKTLKIYMQSNINTMFVDYDEVKEKEPELLEIVGDGWDGIDKDVLIADIPSGNKERGYISINKKEVERAYNCFQDLKKYAIDLKKILN